MSDELKNAPAAGGADVGGGDAALNSVEDIAAAFAEPTDAPEQPEQPERGEQPEGEQPEQDGGQSAEAQPEGEEAQEQDAEDAPDVPMPEGWDEGVWNELPPAARAAVQERETAHAQALAGEAQKYTELRQHREQFATTANAQMQQALATMKSVVEAEYASVNWQQLMQTEPALYVQMQQQYQQRMHAVQQIQQNVAAQVQAYEQRRAAEDTQLMQGEFGRVMPELKALVGAGFGDGKAFAGEVAQYLHAQGAPAQVINALSKGYELKIVAKAMLYDRMQQTRAAAARKVAEAPKVQAPRGVPSGMDAGADRMKKARALLDKNPNSTDALAAVFNAL